MESFKWMHSVWNPQVKHITHMQISFFAQKKEKKKKKTLTHMHTHKSNKKINCVMQS